MKRFALSVIVIVALASPAFAQVGKIGVFSDAAGNSCNLTDTGGGSLINTYVVHKLGPADGSTGARFRIDAPAGATWTYIAFQSIYTSFGPANLDVSVGYGGCQSNAAVPVGNALWSSAVASPTCSFVYLRDPAGGTDINVTDCNYAVVIIPDPGEMRANPDGTCQCDIAVQPTTWGQVKALYR
jgi:hypothetical protein